MTRDGNSSPSAAASTTAAVGEMSRTRVAVVIALSGCTAYLLGLVTLINPVLAAVAAVVSCHPQTHKSVRDSALQGLGLLSATGLAAAATMVSLGQAVVAPVAIVAGVGIAAIFRVRIASLNRILVPIILVVGVPGTSTSELAERAVSVTVGCVIAIAVSFFAQPGTPVTRAHDRAVAAEEMVATILQHSARTLAGESTSHAKSDVAAARQMLSQAQEEAADAHAAARWTLLKARDAHTVDDEVEAAQRHLEAALNVYATSEQLATLTVPTATRTALSEAAEAAASVVNPHVDGHYQQLDEKIASSVAELKTVETTQPLVLNAAIVRDLTKIKPERPR